MALTKVADMTNSVVTRYEKAYYMLAEENPGVWAQFVDWQPPIPEDGGGGSSYDFPVYYETDPVELALTEDADVTPDSLTDSNVTVTPAEYGKTFGVTKKLRYQSRTNLPEIMGKMVGWNRIWSIDRILRRGAVGHGSSLPTQIYHIDGSVAMTDLVVTTDNITYAFLEELAAQAMVAGIEPLKGAGYVAIIPPMLALDLRALNEWKYASEYQDFAMIEGGLGKPFTLAGITFIPSNLGRVYQASGTTAQGATTTTAAVSKAATTLPVTEQTGLAAGSYVTIGTIETESVSPGSNLETVLVTAAAGSSGAGNLTIRGSGKSFGFRFDHASGEAVTEATNVAAIPIIGKNSLIGVHGTDSGRYGKAIAVLGDLDTLKRFSYYGWYWYGGLGVVQKHLVLGKCALSKKSAQWN